MSVLLIHVKMVVYVLMALMGTHVTVPQGTLVSTVKLVSLEFICFVCFDLSRIESQASCLPDENHTTVPHRITIVPRQI